MGWKRQKAYGVEKVVMEGLILIYFGLFLRILKYKSYRLPACYCCDAFVLSQT